MRPLQAVHARPRARQRPQYQKRGSHMAETSQSATPDILVDQRTDGPGVNRIDPTDPAAPMYRLLGKVRTPTTLRDTMIMPVRLGYAGQAPPEGAADALPKWDHLFPNVAVTEIRVPTPDGPARCQIYRPSSSGGGWPLIVYVHGGGFMVGRSEDTDYMPRRICADNNVAVVSINYRLAPEWPFPAGLDDCLAVYTWLRAHGRELGGDPTRIAVAGH